MLGWIQLNINPKFFSYVEYNSASILSFFGRIQLDTLTMHSTLEITNIAHILAKFESRYCGVGLELLTWMVLLNHRLVYKDAIEIAHLVMIVCTNTWIQYFWASTCFPLAWNFTFSQSRCNCHYLELMPYQATSMRILVF